MNRSFFILMLLLFIVAIGNAQNVQKSRVQSQIELANIDWSDQKILVSSFTNIKKHELGLSEEDQLIEESSKVGPTGYMHTRYRQYHKGLLVYGSNYSVHYKDNLVRRTTGFLAPQLSLDVNPVITPEDALKAAIRYKPAEKYSWEEKNSVFPDRPTPELMIVGENFPNSSEHYRLAYGIKLYSAQPVDGHMIFIDANSGNVVTEYPLIMQHSVPAKGKSKYYGEVSFIADSVGPGEYRLIDNTRGDSVVTVQSNRRVFTDDDNYWDLTNENQDEVAVDAHYCASEFYDMMLEKFDHNGVDGEGMALESRIHAGSIVNASWNGVFSSFGDGNCNNGPLTTLEVVGHEFMHGITQFSAGLIYSGESGAINESMSDVFGKALEYFVDPMRFNWFVGQSFKLNPYTIPFRSFEDPNSMGDPAFYEGNFWNKNAGVHTNSSIGNHWFYNLVTGQSGTTETGEPYNIEAISWDDALQIVYHTLTTYLTENSNYNVYYQMSLVSAEELFGKNSTQWKSVKEAWKSVGLPNNVLCLDVFFNEGREMTTCLENEYYEFEVTVANNSAVDYIPSMNGVLRIEGLVFAQLDDPILAGESQVFSVPTRVFFAGYERKTINAEVRVEDPVTRDFDYQFVVNSKPTPNEVQIFAINPRRDYRCFKQEENIDYYLQNNSCEMIPKGTPFAIIFTNLSTGESWRYEDETAATLTNLNRLYFAENVPVPENSDSRFSLALEWTDDPDLNNNTVQFTNLRRNIVTSPYYQDFTTINKDTLIQIDKVRSDIKEYNGESYLFSTGWNTAANLNLLCEDPELSLTGFTGERYQLCVDFSAHSDINLDFDLTQFRNQTGIDFPELFENTSHLKLDINDGVQNTTSLIYGQVEDKQVHHNFQLPDNFKGYLRFTFRNLTGWMGQPDEFDYDVMLFDNLQLSAGVLSTEPTEKGLISIFPNPASENINIRLEESPNKIEMYHISGQKISTWIPSNKNLEINVSALSKGAYFFKLYWGEDLVQTKLFVKD